MPVSGRPRREARPHEDLARAVVRVLTQARQDAGLSRQALADRSDVSVNTIIKIERADTTDPGFTVVARLAQGLGLELDNLIDRARAMAGTPPKPLATAGDGAGVVPRTNIGGRPESEL